MPDEIGVTLGELARRFDEFKADVREDIKDLRAHIDQMGNRMEAKTVNLDFYKVRHSSLEDRVSVVERRLTHMDNVAENSRNERRKLWIAVGVALVSQLGELIAILVNHPIHH